jgi:hypothetical protein
MQGCFGYGGFDCFPGTAYRLLKSLVRDAQQPGKIEAN